jgi:hypothetical protein
MIEHSVQRHLDPFPASIGANLGEVPVGSQANVSIIS